MRNFLLAFSFLPLLSLFAQIDPAFIVHLSRNKLQREHLAYLQSAKKTATDTLSFFCAKYSLQYNEPEKFLEVAPLAGTYFLKDTSALNYACLFFLRSPRLHADRFFALSILNETSSFYARSMKGIYTAAADPSAVSLALIPAPLRQTFSDYKKTYSKKPFVGGLLSTLVPGLGKFYAGRRMSFANTFLTHSFFIITAVEAIKKLGIRNAYTICNLSVSGIFYLSNIYGSYVDVKRVKKEKRKQFLLDAADYFELNSNSSLYPVR